jgi:hypothetical protein
VTASQVPLRPEQIKAARAIYSNYTEDWRRTDAALADLKEKMPGFKSSAALVKAAAVNSLYGTNVYAISAAARRVEDLLDGKDLRSAGPELVEEMASIRLPEGKVRHCPSFASKLAHFFIDYDRFPIYDSYAVKMLRDHLAMTRWPPSPPIWLLKKPSGRWLGRWIWGRTLVNLTVICGSSGSTGNGSRTLNRSTQSFGGRCSRPILNLLN